MFRRIKSRWAATGLIAGHTLLAASAGAIEIEPGLWQHTATEIRNGKPIAPETTTECLSEQEASDFVKTLTDTSGGEVRKCPRYEVNQNGNVVTISSLCGDPKAMSIDLVASITFLDRKNYTSESKIRIVFHGSKGDGLRKADSTWIGPCKK